MLSYSLTTMMYFLTKEWYGFPAHTVNLFMKAYHKVTYKEDLKSHKSDVSLRWYAFLCGFGSDVLFTIDQLRSISFYCQNEHHDWLTKEYISNWFLVIKGIFIGRVFNVSKKQCWKCGVLRCKWHSVLSILDFRWVGLWHTVYQVGNKKVFYRWDNGERTSFRCEIAYTNVTLDFLYILYVRNEKHRFITERLIK